MIGEGDLLGALSDGPGAMALPVSDRMNSDFSVVEPGNSMAVLGQLLLQNKAVIVEDAGKVVGIITKIDYIEYVARRGQ
jgi:cystathionine beta-synthase